MLIKVSLNISESYGIAINRKPTTDEIRLKKTIDLKVEEYSSVLELVKQIERQRDSPTKSSRLRAAERRASGLKHELKKLGVANPWMRVRAYRDATPYALRADNAFE